MSKKYVLVNPASGWYLVVNKGFVGTLSAASRLTEDEANGAAKCAGQFGIECSLKELSVSYGVSYVRPGDLKDGKVDFNTLNPSRRRFATREEANIHGRRFDVRKAKKSKVVGSAGHIGFYVIETSDPVNAAINPATGLTNKL